MTLAACSGAPAAPLPLPDPTEVALERAGEGAIEGTIDGAPFHAGDVRVRVVTREGHEHLDLLIADRPIERCGLPIVRPETLVWLRFSERTVVSTGLSTGTFEGRSDGAHPSHDEPNDTARFEVHYERPTEGGLVAEHRGIGTIEITRAEGGDYEGRLRVCFADEARSCVGGRFVATPCLSRIDGRALREPPGLADEALEAPRGAP